MRTKRAAAKRQTKAARIDALYRQAARLQKAGRAAAAETKLCEADALMQPGAR